MLKRLAIVAILMMIVPAPAPMPGQTVKTSAQSTHKPNNQGQVDQSTINQAPAFVEKQKQAPSIDARHEEPTAGDKEHSVKLTSLPTLTLNDKPKTFWDHVLDWGPWAFGFITTVVAGFQIWLLFRTWKTIDRQANLQEFATRQWVDIEGWSIVGDDPRKFPKWGIYGDEPIRKDEELRDSIEIKVYFEVVNNTPLPLSLKRVSTTIFKGKEEEVFEESAVPDSTILPPKGNTGDNVHVCFVPVTLADREVELYATCGFGFWVSVVVYFLNAEGIETPQLFSREIACNVRGFNFGKYPGKPKTRKEKDGE